MIKNNIPAQRPAVKCFLSSSLYSLEDKINEWIALKRATGTLAIEAISHTADPQRDYFSALVYYTHCNHVA